jgi:Glyoxalase-like domain
MTARPHNISFDCADPDRLAGFWSQVTGFRQDPDDRNQSDDPEAFLVASDGQPDLLFVKVREGNMPQGKAAIPPCRQATAAGAR